MADLVVTAADVQAVDGATIARGAAGATITAGQPVYVDPADSQVKLAANTSEALAKARGVSLHGALAGQPVAYITDGDLDIGATLTVGMPYILSGAGAVAPASDGASSDWMTLLGIATAADNLKLNIHASGVQLASDIT